MAKPKFPSIVFVTSNSEPDGSEFFLVHLNPQEAGDIAETRVVATYKLVETRKLTFTPRWSDKRGRFA